MEGKKCKQKVVSKVTMETEAETVKTRFQKGPASASRCDAASSLKNRITEQLNLNLNHKLEDKEQRMQSKQQINKHFKQTPLQEHVWARTGSFTIYAIPKGLPAGADHTFPT